MLGLHYAIPWPNREMRHRAGRSARSPAYERLADANAGFGSKMGWERANFFAPAGEAPAIEYSWGSQNWLPVDRRRAACHPRRPWRCSTRRRSRSTVVTGADAEAALQWICTNDVAVEIGRTVYTGLLNARGTYESDLTVTRVDADEFLLVSSSATTERDQD